jgi:hypothetical protein
MWSEEMDKKIRDAAENDIHGYEDKNWQKMETLLNKHLPNEKKRRRGLILFLLAGLLLITAAYFMSRGYSSTDKPVTEQKDISSTKNTASQPASTDPALPATQENSKPGNSVTPSSNESTGIQQLPASAQTENKSNKITTVAAAPPLSQNESVTINTKQAGKASRKKDTRIDKSSVSKDPIETENKQGNDQPIADITVTNPSVNKDIDKPAIENPDKKQVPDPVTDASASEKTISPEIKEDKPADPVAPVPDQPVSKKKTIKSPSSKISFNFSAGPDISSVGVNPGKFQVQYGIGVGYSISDRFTIRTGFYAARKIYSADSTNYKTDFTSGPYSFKLSNIDANCLVYEIPLTVSYNFGAAKKHNWFVSTGLSSFIMKKEKYGYTYTNPWGQTMLHTYSYNNKNTHLFSVVNLSGGYQYNFNKRFSLLAEPYVKLPVGGVGVGKVKLNSAGVLFTASFRPFVK